MAPESGPGGWDGRMQRKRFAEAQFIAVPREHKARARTGDVARHLSPPDAGIAASMRVVMAPAGRVTQAIEIIGVP